MVLRQCGWVIHLNDFLPKDGGINNVTRACQAQSNRPIPPELQVVPIKRHDTLKRSTLHPARVLSPFLHILLLLLPLTMTPRKARDRRAAAQPSQRLPIVGSGHPSEYLQQPLQAPPQPSDYESDAAYLSDLPSAPPPPDRTNEELNLSVLRRHNPHITSILSVAPYAVVYLFSATTESWEKSGIEGTLFVCQLLPGDIGEDRYGVMILNRRGLENFDTELSEGGDVEITEDYVILQVTDEEGKKIYGLWIFSEPPPSSTSETRTINAGIIKECAVQAGISRKAAEERSAEVQQSGTYGHYQEPTEEEEVGNGFPMAHQLSLREMFGQQREMDDGWSVKVHSPPTKTVQPQTVQPQPMFVPSSDTEFFRTGRFGPQQQQPVSMPGQQDGGRDVLGELFRKAGLGHQGGVSKA